MIHVPRSIPDPLDPAKVAAEREAARVFYADPKNAKKSFPGFKLYKSDEVKQALTRLFGNKCAYCESSLPGQPLDVEHFRPKSAVIDDGKLRYPGYWWLAAEWNNLLPSCIDCNRARKQELPGEKKKKLRGKANQFPLAPGSPRASAPGEEAAERALLLDPCRDSDLDGHVEFLEKEGWSLVQPSKVGGVESERGKASIDVYGLQRSGLVQTRSDHLLTLGLALSLLKAGLVLLQADPASAQGLKLRDEGREAILKLKSGGMQYAGLARDYFAAGGGV